MESRGVTSQKRLGTAVFTETTAEAGIPACPSGSLPGDAGVGVVRRGHLRQGRDPSPHPLWFPQPTLTLPALY